MSEARKFRKKPVVVEAQQWYQGIKPIAGSVIHDGNGTPLHVEIKTLEGVMVANHGDWIIKGVKGEFYPCKPDIFEATYEPV